MYVCKYTLIQSSRLSISTPHSFANICFIPSEPEHIHDLDVVGTMNIESPVLSSKKPDGKDGAPEEDISGTDTRTLVDLQDEALCSGM